MSSHPLPFASPTLADAFAVRQITQRTEAMGSDLAFANIFLLKNKYNTEIFIRDGILYRHFDGNTRLQGYAYPCGATDEAAADEALQLLEADAEARRRELSFCLLTEADAAQLQRLRPGQFICTSDRGNSDYLYRQSDLAQLPGTSYHAKRNHLARWNRLYPGWHFQPYLPELRAAALSVADAWYQASRRTAALEHERHAIGQALEYAAELQLCGGLIFVGEQPVALALGSIISPQAADIHYEKCHPDFRQAYPAINHCMAEALASVTYINREEDMNVDGLRQAKLSYHPALLLHKWNATRADDCPAIS